MFLIANYSNDKLPKVWSWHSGETYLFKIHFPHCAMMVVTNAEFFDVLMLCWDFREPRSSSWWLKKKPPESLFAQILVFNHVSLNLRSRPKTWHGHGRKSMESLQWIRLHAPTMMIMMSKIKLHLTLLSCITCAPLDTKIGLAKNKSSAYSPNLSWFRWCPAAYFFLGWYYVRATNENIPITLINVQRNSYVCICARLHFEARLLLLRARGIRVSRPHRLFLQNY